MDKLLAWNQASMVAALSGQVTSCLPLHFSFLGQPVSHFSEDPSPSELHKHPAVTGESNSGTLSWQAGTQTHIHTKYAKFFSAVFISCVNI